MFRNLGENAALAAFGIKTAGTWNDFLSSLKSQGIGNPGKTFEQFRTGKLFKPGSGLLHQNLPRTPGDLAAALAIPVMGSVLLARAAPETQRGELVGDLIGRSAGSLLGHPLGGVLGQLGGGMLLAPVGRALGRSWDSFASAHNPQVASGE